MHFLLLRCLAKAIAKHGVKFVCNLVPGGDVVYDIAASAWEDYCKNQREEALRVEVQELAQAPADHIREEVNIAVQAEAAAQPPEVQQALTAYLTQVPAAIRRSLRRPSDPTGTTVPASLSMNRPESLAQLLPPRPPRFQPGTRPLPGVDWVLEELVGVGGFGEVWKARNALLHSAPPVALKFCLDPSAVPALRNEAGVLDRLMQLGPLPGIVPLLHTYLSADPPCLEYEFIEGGDLAALILELVGCRHMTSDLASRLILQLAQIIAHAHRADPPIVHGDLKPANVLVQKRSNGKVSLRVTDFGIGGLAAARAARQQSKSRQELLTEAVRGAYTPLYASPEQMMRRRGEPADPRDDVHALGVIWYQLLKGDLRAGRPSGREWRNRLMVRDTSAALLDLLESCFEEAADRPANAAVLAERLQKLRGEEKGAKSPDKGSPEPPKPPAQSPPRKGGIIDDIFTHSIMLSDGTIADCISEEPEDTIDEHGREEEDRREEQDQRRRDELDRVEGRHAQPGYVHTNELGMRFAWIPPGTFLMGGDKHPREKPAHRVTISKGFYMGIYPVSQAQWRTIMDYNPSKFQSDDRPVEMVSWHDCQEFCQKLAARTGNVIRLPTEAEWEYACRAGTHRDYYSGDGEEALHKVGWYEQNSPEHTQPVGQLLPNAWGLYDMHGNVWEWCQDWYAKHTAASQIDPRGPSIGKYRVTRGGGWGYEYAVCRSAFRGCEPPECRSEWIGCRVCFCLD